MHSEPELSGGRLRPPAPSAKAKLRGSVGIFYNYRVLKRWYAKRPLFPLSRAMKVYLSSRRLVRCDEVKLLAGILTPEHLELFRTRYSNLLSADVHTYEPEWIIDKFRGTPRGNPAPADPQKPHSNDTASRNAACRHIRDIIKAAGLVEYSYQSSSADNVEGLRKYYWTQDMKVAPQSDTVSYKHIVSMVDVDYYVDMERHLTHVNVPHILYTFQPITTGRTTPHYNYSFNSQNEVEYFLKGSRSFKHLLWHYTGDSLMTQSRGKRRSLIDRLCGYAEPEELKPLPFTDLLESSHMSSTWQVVKFTWAEERELILLLPKSTHRSYNSILASVMVESERLERYNVVEGDFARLRVSHGDELYVSTSQLGVPTSATTPISIDQIAHLKSMRKNALYYSNLVKEIEKAHLAVFGTDVPRLAGDIMLTYYTASMDHHTPLMTVDAPRVLDPRVMHFAPCGSKYGFVGDVGKPTVKSYMNPIIDRAIAPEDTVDNEEYTIETRIRHVAVDLPPQFREFLKEFLELVIPDEIVHSFLPREVGEVFDAQSRPSQQAILHRGDTGFISNKATTQAFMKKEAQQKLAAARNISTVPPKAKLDSATIIMELTELLKKLDWFAFGQTPREIATRVVDIADGANTLIATDISKMDRDVKDFMRDFELELLYRMYPPKYHREIKKLHWSVRNAQGFGAHGTQYSTGDGRLSGELGTAAFNTILLSLTMYCCFRQQLGRTTVYCTPKEAWSRLGIYGGDDGLTADLDPDLYTDTARRMGFTAKVETFTNGEAGVNFLSRFYSEGVWHGDRSSVCDIKRTLSKFHTRKLGGTSADWEYLVSKSHSYWITDRRTPIVGDFVRAVRRVTDNTDRAYTGGWDRDMHSWFSWFEVEDNWPQSEDDEPGDDPCEWMNEYPLEPLREMGFDFEQFYTWIESAVDLESLMNAPPLIAAEVTRNIGSTIKDDMVYQVDGEIVGEGMLALELETPPDESITRGDPGTRYASEMAKPGIDDPRQTSNTRHSRTISERSERPPKEKHPKSKSLKHKKNAKVEAKTASKTHRKKPTEAHPKPKPQKKAGPKRTRKKVEAENVPNPRHR